MKILVAHRDCLRSATEDMVLSYNGKNYMWTLYHYRKNGRLWRTGKRHSRISSRRWKMFDITSESFTINSTGKKFKLLEVELDTILEIYNSNRAYFERRHIEKAEQIRGVIQ